MPLRQLGHVVYVGVDGGVRDDDEEVRLSWSGDVRRSDSPGTILFAPTEGREGVVFGLTARSFV